MTQIKRAQFRDKMNGRRMNLSNGVAGQVKGNKFSPSVRAICLSSKQRVQNHHFSLIQNIFHPNEIKYGN